MGNLNDTESMAYIYKQIGRWFELNADTLASGSIETMSVPITLIINIDNATVTVEKKSKYYVMEDENELN
jgi:hypothetical protein